MEVPNRERAVDEMNVFEPCPFSKFVVGNEPGEHGGVTPRCAFVGGVLLEVDGHVMGGLGPTTTKPWSGYGDFFSLKWRRLIKDGPLFVRGRHVSQDTNWRLLANMVRH